MSTFRPIQVGIAWAEDCTWTSLFIAIPVQTDVPTETLVARAIDEHDFDEGDVAGWWIYWDVPITKWHLYQEMCINGGA